MVSGSAAAATAAVAAAPGRDFTPFTPARIVVLASNHPTVDSGADDQKQEDMKVKIEDADEEIIPLGQLVERAVLFDSSMGAESSHLR